MKSLSAIKKFVEKIGSTIGSNRGMESYRQNPRRRLDEEDVETYGFKKGGKVSSASKRADGIATKGKTKGRMV
jgi:hypothetical protein